jgi:quercetin dioxygenase-like cupin family protein
MKKIAFFSIVLLALTSTKLLAQEEIIFPKGEISTTDNHTGTVWLKEINSPDTNFDYSIVIATFAPNAKLDWHMHPGGQILLITAGTGYYQEKGKPIQIIKKGDVIKCLPNIEHWHGATQTTDFTYLATTPTQKGKTMWLKRVTDEEYNQINIPATNNKIVEQEIINLSKKKWLLMADKNIDSLNTVFNEKAVFVHMGGSWGKDQEINIIKSGGIWYKQADIQETSVQIIGNTAILLNKIKLTAIVGGNEVVNPFMVTEVYIQQNDNWSLGSLSFTKLMTP